MTGSGAVSSSPQQLERAVVLGCAIDRLDMAGTLAHIEQAIADGRTLQQVSVNAAKLVAMQRDPELRSVVESCELVNADGQSVVWASHVLGDPLPERVAGIDLMSELMALAERKGYGVYVLGAREEILEKAVARLRDLHPDLRIVGYHHGYFSEDEDPVIAEEVRAAAPDMLFVAMTSPRKEHWLGRHGAALGIPFRMGVGGSIDVVAGLTVRAPRVWQRLGLEWAYRLRQEPGRLWRRYLRTNTTFLVLLMRALVARAVGATLTPLSDRRQRDRRLRERRAEALAREESRRVADRRGSREDPRGTGAE